MQKSQDVFFYQPSSKLESWTPRSNVTTQTQGKYGLGKTQRELLGVGNKNPVRD